MRILVVDDVAVVRMVISRALTRAGYEVVEASSGEEALGLLETERVDILLSDVWMPGSGGLALIHKARSINPSLAVVAMSGGSPQTSLAGSLDDAEAAGAMVTLMKPIDPEELQTAMKDALHCIGKDLP
ncbi:response regulator [Magnetospirillum fulvum]|uniref:Response regulator receiver domain-containing protein (CheY) n=1 Tax=Magnetospirillum fulvum MGU-K5 TaxID=1316936 RepID=S9TLT2_MAGFU|nr:response regulator [Magnetospirillum fulvum]EPY03241.1 Response regulator receiver domain-containing protein (CheY) [Magnetospirillum fulvum MGU-K5]